MGYFGFALQMVHVHAGRTRARLHALHSEGVATGTDALGVSAKWVRSDDVIAVWYFHRIKQARRRRTGGQIWL